MNGMTTIKAAIAAVGAWLSYMLGGWDMILKVLVGFVVLDYLTGVIAAYHRKDLSSNVGMYGIAKKICLFIPVAMAHWLDQAVVTRVVGTELLRNVAIWFYLANEGLSIIENLGEIGILIPAPLLEALKQLKEKGKADTGG